MACSNYMPVPFLSFNWQNNEHKIEICEELFYTFEKFKSILSFKVSSNKNNGPRGASTFLNLMFQKNFEKHTESSSNYGSIDIQFDYNF